jgi:hypothetical protein
VESGGDPRWGLWGQFQTQPIEQQLLLGLRLGVTAQDQGAPIGGGQMDIDHLDGGEFLQDGAGRESWCQGAQPGLEGDPKARGEEGDEDMRFDPRIELMVDRSNAQVALEFLRTPARLW